MAAGEATGRSQAGTQRDRLPWSGSHEGLAAQPPLPSPYSFPHRRLVGEGTQMDYGEGPEVQNLCQRLGCLSSPTCQGRPRCCRAHPGEGTTEEGSRATGW